MPIKGDDTVIDIILALHTDQLNVLSLNVDATSIWRDNYIPKNLEFENN